MNARPPIPLRPSPDALIADQRRAWTRALTGVALSRSGKLSAESIVKRAWPHDAAALLLTRAATSPTTTGSAAALSPTVIGAFLSGVAPQSAAVQLFKQAVQFDFTGVGQFFIPRGSLTPVPIFIGEGQPMPMVKATIDGTVVGPVQKIMVGSAVTGQLEYANPETASAIVGKLLSEQAALSLDAVAFDNVAGDDVRPAGLLHGVPPIAPVSGGGINAMAGDLANMAGAMSDAKVSADDFVLVANPRQAIKLKLLAGPSFDHAIYSTSALPSSTVVTIAPAALAVGSQGAPQVAVSKLGLAHFEDTSPLPISDGGTVAAPTLSAWQADLVMLKVTLNATWAVLQPGAVQLINGTTW